MDFHDELLYWLTLTVIGAVCCYLVYLSGYLLPHP